MTDNSDLLDPMNDIMNFDEKDAFAEAGQLTGIGTYGGKVHLRIQQRNRRKCVLTVQGLADDLDLKKICKALRRKLFNYKEIIEQK